MNAGGTHEGRGVDDAEPAYVLHAQLRVRDAPRRVERRHARRRRRVVYRPRGAACGRHDLLVGLCGADGSESFDDEAVPGRALGEPTDGLDGVEHRKLVERRREEGGVDQWEGEGVVRGESYLTNWRK